MLYICNIFAIIIYKCLLLARVFVFGNLCQPSLLFAIKAGAYPSGAPFKLSTLRCGSLGYTLTSG
jgi:hypothetical protein